MSEKSKENGPVISPPKRRRQVDPKKKPTPSEPLKPWNVILYNDNVNTTDQVVNALMKVLRWNSEKAKQKVNEIQNGGKDGHAVVATTHKEKAELYVLQLEEQPTKETLKVMLKQA
jgi:ATP-dependent Clp protease adapter protein ClpS